MFFPLTHQQLARTCFALAALSLCLVPSGYGQETRPTQQLSAPPPMTYVSKLERAQLDAARDVKARMRLSVELANSHLVNAEALTSRDQFDSASAELGNYRGIIEDALRFLLQTNTTNRDLYRRLELALRAHSIRIEAIRRATPAEYAGNIKVIGDHTRKARTDALNAFYGDTVVRESVDEIKEPPNVAPTKIPDAEIKKP